MSNETASLIIKVDTKETKDAKKNLADLTVQAGVTEKATDKLKESFKAIIGPLLAVTGAIELAKKVFEVTKEFETLERQVIRVAGSIETGQHAFVALRELATELHADLADLTGSFVHLADAGLNPSKEALIAYRNIAKGLGVNIQSVTDAIASASLGQFRGLNQLLVKAVETEDGLALTFNGATTRIKKDANELQNYLVNLGKTAFAPAKLGSESLSNSVADLKNAYDELFYAISKGTGAKNIFADAFKGATAAIRELTAEIESGQLQASIVVIAHKFDGFRDAAINAFDRITSLFGKDAPFWREVSLAALNDIEDAFINLPENVSALMGIVGAEFSRTFLYIEAGLRNLKAAFDNTLEFIGSEAKNVGRLLAVELNPLSGLGAHQAALAEFATNAKAAFDKYITAAKAIDEQDQKDADNADNAAADEIASILDTRDAAVNAYKVRIVAANALREAYDKTKKAREESEKTGEKSDPLQIRGDTSKPKPIIDTQDFSEFKQLKESLQLAETTIAQSYIHRKGVILKLTKEGSDEQQALLKELNAQTELQYTKAAQDRKEKAIGLQDDINKAIAEGRLSDVDALQAALQHEEEIIAASYGLRKEQILRDTSLTEEAKTKKILELEKNRALAHDEAERRRQKVELDHAADFFGNLSTIAAAFGAKGARFAKAAAIVQATIKTYEAAQSAYASQVGIPYIGPALGVAAAAAAIAAGLANVRAIQSQQTPGYAQGGFIPAGGRGLVGETGVPEIVHGPAVVTSARGTADRQGTDAGKDQRVFVNVVNQTDGVATVSERTDGDRKTIEVLIKRVQTAVAGNIRSGEGPIGPAIASAFGVRRGTV